jgi:hypothetical protein
MRWSTLVFAIAAFAAGPLAALIVRELPAAATRFEQLSVATLAGLLVGQLIGARRGTLYAILAGPAVGFFAGLVDLRGFRMLLDQGIMTVANASLVPIWGGVIGLFVAMFSRGWAKSAVKFLMIAAIDAASRWCWSELTGRGFIDTASESRWLAESLVYSPTALAAVLLTPPVGRGVKAEPTGGATSS